jgi:cytochrome P450
MTDAPKTEPQSEDEFSEFDLHQKDIRVGAECMWARMRDQSRLPHSDKYGGFYIAAKYVEVQQAFQKPELYSSAKGGVTIPEARTRTRHIPSETDPPLHREYKAIIVRFLTNEKVKIHEVAVRQLARNLLDAFRDRRQVDFVEAFARPLPVYFALQILGLPLQDAPLLEGLVGALHEEVATGIETGAGQQLTQYVERTLIIRKESVRSADEDIVSAILLGTVLDRTLTFDEQVSMVRILLVAGFDSTAIALAAAAKWLAEHPEDAQKLRDKPELMDKANEEFVRFASPTAYLRRTVAQDAQLGNTQLRAGDTLVLALGAANRDPSVFERPDTVDFDRPKNFHAGFGIGIHRCIGSFLAKMEMRVGLGEFLNRYREFRIDPSAELKYSSGLNQGLLSLPLILGSPSI